MENNVADKRTKTAKPSGNTSIYIRKELKKRITADLIRINKKDFGKAIRFDEYLALAISMITPEHLQHLQEKSMSNADRLERDYRAYIAQFGQISKDDYLGKRLNGEVKPQEVSNILKPELTP